MSRIFKEDMKLTSAFLSSSIEVPQKKNNVILVDFQNMFNLINKNY